MEYHKEIQEEKEKLIEAGNQEADDDDSTSFDFLLFFSYFYFFSFFEGFSSTWVGVFFSVLDRFSFLLTSLLTYTSPFVSPRPSSAERFGFFDLPSLPFSPLLVLLRLLAFLLLLSCLIGV